MFSLFKRREEEIVAIFDVGNGSIGGAIVKLEKHGLPVLLYSHRLPVTFEAHQTAKNLLSTMKRLLKDIAHNVAVDGMKHVRTSPFHFHKLRDVHCVFASPWYISQTRIVRKEWEKAIPITHAITNDIIKKDQEEFDRNLASGAYQQIFGADNRVLEKRVINAKLNGYAVSEPVGKHARELELTLFSSYISKNIVSAVEDGIRAEISVRSFHHYSFGFASWGTAQILFPDVHDYFFLDISGETTDISLVVKDVLIETVSFPMGRSTILRKMVRDLKVEPEVALSFLSLYFADKLETTFVEKVSGILKIIEQDWFDSLITALKNFQKIYALPRSAFITADVDTSGFFLDALKKELPAELNVPKRTLAVTFMGADKVQEYIELVPGTVQDPFISIESVLINNLFSHGL